MTSRPEQMHGIIFLVERELDRAEEKFFRFNSAHEGFAVLKEEVDELWEVIKDKPAHPNKMKAEAIQVAAMAIRFLKDKEKWS